MLCEAASSLKSNDSYLIYKGTVREHAHDTHTLTSDPNDALTFGGMNMVQLLAILAAAAPALAALPSAISAISARLEQAPQADATGAKAGLVAASGSSSPGGAEGGTAFQMKRDAYLKAAQPTSFTGAIGEATWATQYTAAHAPISGDSLNFHSRNISSSTKAIDDKTAGATRGSEPL